MAVNYRRVAKWASAVSIVLLIAFMAILPNAVENLEPMLDPELENVTRLDAGESDSFDLKGSHVYVALRLSEGEDDPIANLRMIEDDGQEFSGDGPTRLHVERLVNGTTYVPVRVFMPPSGGTYTLYNDGDSVLWLVDDTASELKVFSDPVILAMFGTCCFGVMSGIIALIFAILMLQNKSKDGGRTPSGLIIDGKVMTTDELYRSQNQKVSSNSNVPNPFIETENNDEEKVSKISKPEPEESHESSKDAWKGWDEG